MRASPPKPSSAVEVRDDLGAIAFLYTGDLQGARDLVQETLVRAWQHWDRLATHPNPAAWSRKVLHNLAVSRWRRQKLERFHRRASRAVSGELDVGHLDLALYISQLPVNQRKALVLHDVIGLSVNEISEELGAPVGTVRSWLSRGREALARQLGQSQMTGD